MIANLTLYFVLIGCLACCQNQHHADDPGDAEKQFNLSTTIEFQSQQVPAILSPDHSKVVFEIRNDGDREIYVADADGKNVQQLTHNRSTDYVPSWSPDGSHIVFCSTRSGIHQIFKIGVNGRNLQQMTKHKHGARLPKYSSTGWLTYQVMHPSQGKSQPSDTVITKGTTTKTLLKNEDVSDYQWSPRGNWLAIGSPGKLTIYDATNGSSRNVDLMKHDQRLFAHSAYRITWFPAEPKFACEIRFLGGRAGDAKLFGDRQVFLVSTDGSMTTIENASLKNADLTESLPPLWRPKK